MFNLDFYLIPLFLVSKVLESTWDVVILFHMQDWESDLGTRSASIPL